jgi:hypothetical protein
MLQKRFEDTKVVIRRRKSQKDKQYNEHTKKNKRINNTMDTLKRTKGQTIQWTY